jgi:hypothetical protein
MHAVSRRFEHIILSRAGAPVFQMKGDGFAEIGASFAGDGILFT